VSGNGRERERERERETQGTLSFSSVCEDGEAIFAQIWQTALLNAYVHAFMLPANMTSLNAPAHGASIGCLSKVPSLGGVIQGAITVDILLASVDKIGT
jgi:hypothetical protein